jgi:hypothetical protein
MPLQPFCDFIEKDSSNLKSNFLNTLQNKLLDLYGKALKLQWVNLQFKQEFDYELDGEEFNRILSDMSVKLNGSRYYWHIFDPTNAPGQPY